MSEVTVLYVDDDQPNLDLFELTIGDHYRVVTTTSATAGLALMAREEVGVVLTDQVMPDMDGVQFLELVYQRYPNTVRIVVTAYQDVELLLGAINAGRVSDYVIKPWEVGKLRELIDRAAEQYLRRRALEQRCAEREYLVGELRQRYDPSIVVGANGGLREVMHIVRTVAPTHSTVLLRGETGTGKELIARAIHDMSDRWERTIIKVDCASLAPGLLESELFGHERGAFTGATNVHRGRFELANEGTLFLDEVGDLPLSLQPKLLRVLQDRVVERLGSEKTLEVDVRVIAATNRNLEQQVARGNFRRDLFYRLNVVPVFLPPLRKRLQDLDELLRHFLRKHGGWRGEQMTVTPNAIRLLRNHPWPGNVRELENVVERALLLSKGSVLDALDFGLTPALGTPPKGLLAVGSSEDIRQSIRHQERRELQQLLLETRGNISEAARRLDIAPTTLRSRLKRLDLIR